MSENKNRGFFSKFYGIFDSIFPFQNANEFSFIRVKANIGVIIGLMAFSFFAFEIFFGYSFLVKKELIEPISFIQEEPKPTLAIVDFNSAITIPMSENFMQKMEILRTDNTVKSVLLVFNSGGGSPAASDDIAHYIEYFQKTKPVYSYIQSICASGAYYIASATSEIYTNPTAIVGSIGVVLPHYNFSKLAKTIGVEENHITAGKHKVPLSLLKTMSPKDRKYIENQLLNPTYKVFKNYVGEQRDLNSSEMDLLAEGIIYTGSMDVIQKKLIDKQSSFIELKIELLEAISSSNSINIDDIHIVRFNAEKENPKSLLGMSVDIGSSQFQNLTKESLSF